MKSFVQGYQLNALHVFQVRTLQSAGFGTRVTLSNKSQKIGALVTDYRVDLTVFSPDGLTNTFFEGIAHLPADTVLPLDCSEWHTSLREDQVMIFHLIPLRLLPAASKSGEVDLDRSEIWSLFTAQDHYVEYYTLDGFSSGVLYQSGAFNYRKFSKEETTVIQAPKVFISSEIDTVLSILHTSFEAGYNRDAVLRCALLDEQAKPIARWTSRIRPFTAQLISMKEKVIEGGVTTFTDGITKAYVLLAICENAALLPLIFNVEADWRCLAVEHSLPPIYYGQSVAGSVRAQMISNLRNSGVFATEEL